MGELNRLVLLHSSPWEKNAEGLKRIRSDYESMKRKLSIALKKLEIMGSEVREDSPTSESPHSFICSVGRKVEA